MGLLTNSGRKNTDNALMPVCIEQCQPPRQSGLIQRKRCQEFLCLLLHTGFNCSAFAVHMVELDSQSASLVGIIGQQTGNPDTHIIQPPGSIQARPDNKPEIGRADTGVVTTGNIQQGENARPGFAFADSAQPLFNKDSVVLIQRHHVCNGSQRDQIQQAAEIGPFALKLALLREVAPKRRQNVEHHTDASRILAQKRTAFLVWIHNRISGRQRLAG